MSIVEESVNHSNFSRSASEASINKSGSYFPDQTIKDSVSCVSNKNDDLNRNVSKKDSSMNMFHSNLTMYMHPSEQQRSSKFTDQFLVSENVCPNICISVTDSLSHSSKSFISISKFNDNKNHETPPEVISYETSLFPKKSSVHSTDAKTNDSLSAKTNCASSINSNDIKSKSLIVKASLCKHGDTRSCCKTCRSQRNPQVIKRNLVCENNSPIQLKYIIKEKIGEGSWGSVHVAIERVTRFQRAVKKVTKAKNPDFSRFREEINFLKNLDHPNIIKLYEIYEDSANIYMVMEYCNGGELFDRVRSTVFFSEEIAARLTYQMLSAVSYLHSKGIVHRDLKLENFLFLTKATTSPMKLIDFGLAKNYNDDFLMKTKVGTIYYVPPEVLKGEYNEKCDLWSIGVILYILLSGVPPFNGKDDSSIITRIMASNVDFSNKVWKKSPAWQKT